MKIFAILPMVLSRISTAAAWTTTDHWQTSLITGFESMITIKEEREEDVITDSGVESEERFDLDSEFDFDDDIDGDEDMDDENM
jgi:hypothetical protein